MSESATILLEEAPRFEPRDGLVYVIDPETGVTRAMRLHTFFASFHNAAKCMQECHRSRKAEVVPFPVKDAAEH